MWTEAPNPTDPVSIIERLDTFLVHVAERHAAGLAWNGPTIHASDVLQPARAGADQVPRPADPAAVLGPPGLGDRQTMHRDLGVLRRLLGTLAARLRYGTDREPLLLAIADGVVLARGAMSVRDMRDRMLHEVQARLHRLRRDVIRRIEAIGSVDIRLDAWAMVGDEGRAGVRAYLDGVLQQQADYASFGRGNLGRLVALRRELQAASNRVEARVRGERARITHPDTGPLTLAAVSRQTPPLARPYAPASSTRQA